MEGLPLQRLGRGRQKSILSAGQQFSRVKCANVGAAKTIHHFQHPDVVQECLAHKKHPLPWDHHWTLVIVLLWSPRRGLFLMSEVPL